MTAQIAGFVTRAEAGLRKARSVSTSITPSKGGVGLHYGGPAQRIRTHADCVKTWLGWQRYHMDTHGWSDIAYTFGVCDHGYLLAGRGVGVRTAANGTDAGNQSFYAICWIGGEGQTPTRAALDAIEYGIVMLRSAKDGNGAAIAVWPHQKFKGTACPGSALVAAARLLDGKALSLPTPAAPSTPTPPPTPPIPQVPTKENDMYSLIRIDGGPAVYAVRPGVWEHVRDVNEFNSITRGGVTVAGRQVEDLTADEADTLKAFVLRAV